MGPWGGLGNINNASCDQYPWQQDETTSYNSCVPLSRVDKINFMLQDCHSFLSSLGSKHCS